MPLTPTRVVMRTSSLWFCGSWTALITIASDQSVTMLDCDRGCYPFMLVRFNAPHQCKLGLLLGPRASPFDSSDTISNMLQVG